ncbi:MAG: flagellar basal-body MS-ring/collar protein FliF, partial [Janthinobacterium lividum]
MAEEATVSGGARALAVVKQVRERITGMDPIHRRWMLAGGAMVLALAMGVLWFTGRPDWRVLFSGLEARDTSQVSQELAAAGIPFRATADGTGVEVPAESLDKARMEVAAKGMPQTGRLGFELFDKPNWVGSEFDEKVNYQRALEGELEHTISTLGAVRSARVHLVLPQESLFASETRAAKASVVLKLRKSTLGQDEAEGIRNLVAGAVQSLAPEQVTLVDADGRANLQRPHAAGEGEVEQAMEAKLIAMLEPLAGPGNVRATVHVTYDEAAEERTDEVYDPAGSATLSMQKSEQTSGGAMRAGGVPGTASNTPAAAPVGAVQGSSTAAAPGMPPLLQQPAGNPLPVWPGSGSGPQSKREENGTYAISKHTIHTEAAAGRVR